jgi:16S rRNA (uracil1498-N3)-methyltransferase
MRRRFFVDRFERESASLRDEAAEHLGRVLRAEPGQLYELSDGQRVWLGRVERVAVSKRGPSRIDFALVEPIEGSEPSLRIELLISIVKFDRFEWCLEKATELGVDEIVPLAAARTDKALITAAAKRHERWKRIILESAQQSRRLRPPVVHPALAPDKAFPQSSAALKVLLSERPGAKSLKKVLDQESPSVAQALLPALRTEGPVRSSSATAPETQATPTISLAVGPEGGWTDDEIATAATAGFLEASLGENILRTETAVIASVAVLQFALRTH